MVIDVHNHILPGIDDGSADMEETIQMLNLALQEGIRGIVATSHFEAGAEDALEGEYEAAYAKVSDYLKEHQIPITLYRGNELFYSESLLAALKDGRANTINGTRYILVEFPIYADAMYIERALHNLQYAGYQPILAHAERYASMREGKRIEALVEQGVLIQINASSVTGKAGWMIRHFCVSLMKKRCVHLLGTDAHGSTHRRPRIQLCFEYLDRKVGASYRRQISEENPKKILEGEMIRGKN